MLYGARFDHVGVLFAEMVDDIFEAFKTGDEKTLCWRYRDLLLSVSLLLQVGTVHFRLGM